MKEKIKYIFSKILTAFHILIGLLVIGSIIVVFIKPSLIKLALDHVKMFIQNAGSWNYLIGGSIALIESFPLLGIVFPGQTIMLFVCGFFGASHFWSLILVVWIGAILGNLWGYIAGWLWGEEFIEKYGPWFSMGQTETEYIKKGLDKHGWWMVASSKFHNTTRAFVPFVVGSMKMKKTKFLFFNLIGTLLRTLFIVCLGVFFAQYYEVIMQYVRYIMIGVLIALGLYIYFFKRKDFKEYWEKKQREIEDL